MGADLLKFDNDEKGLTRGNWLSFFATIIGIIASATIAFVVFHFQYEATNALQNRTKYSEIAIALHKSVRICKNNLKYSAALIRIEGFENYINVLSKKVFECRSELLPFISGLKVFRVNEYGFNERKLLIKFDKRMQNVFDLMVSLNNEKPELKSKNFSDLNDSVAGLIYGEMPNINLDSIETLLLAEPGAP